MKSFEKTMDAQGFPLLRYLASVLSIALAWGVTRLLGDLLQGHRSLLFFTSVVLSAMYGGLGPGLVATACAALALSVMSCMTSGGPLKISEIDLIRSGLFLFVAVMVSWMSAARHRAQLDLHRAHAELESRVRERTAALSIAVRGLEQEVEERKRSERALRESEARCLHDISARMAAERDRVIYEARLRDLASQLLSTEEAERRRIAAQLHDGIGQALAVAQMKLESLPLQPASRDLPSEALAEVLEVRDLIQCAITHTRSLTCDLSPPILYEAGLRPALEWLAARTRRQHALAVEVRTEEWSGSVDDPTRGLVFAAVRELLMNVVKHAGATRVVISLSRRHDRVGVVVADDGAGFDPSRLEAHSASDGGFGLFNLRERLSHLGGTFELESGPGRGTRVAFEVPLQADGERNSS